MERAKYIAYKVQKISETMYLSRVGLIALALSQNSCKKKTYAVFGLGRYGAAVARELVAKLR